MAITNSITSPAPVSTIPDKIKKSIKFENILGILSFIGLSYFLDFFGLLSNWYKASNDATKIIVFGILNIICTLLIVIIFYKYNKTSTETQFNNLVLKINEVVKQQYECQQKLNALEDRFNNSVLKIDGAVEQQSELHQKVKELQYKSNLFQKQSALETATEDIEELFKKNGIQIESSYYFEQENTLTFNINKKRYELSKEVIESIKNIELDCELKIKFKTKP